MCQSLYKKSLEYEQGCSHVLAFLGDGERLWLPGLLLTKCSFGPQILGRIGMTQEKQILWVKLGRAGSLEEEA